MAECIKCGECCKFVFFPSSKDFEADRAKDWLDIRGIKAENGLLKVAMPCPKLTAERKCGIQDNKPKVCSDFEPGSIPECPLYKRGEEKMSKVFDRKILTAEDIRAAKSEGKKSVEGFKQFTVEQFKAMQTPSGVVVIEGYANTKNKADRYGDIPTVFAPLRDYVYGLEEFHKNPVCLLDHMNSVNCIAGSFNPDLGGYIYEDEYGLKFRMVFSNSIFPPCAHARTVYQEGHGRALSIGGSWSFEDKDNLDHLTHAEIYEVSLVGVGADPDALSQKGLNSSIEVEKGMARNLRACIASYEESIKAGRVLNPEDENALHEAKEKLTSLIKNEEEEKCQVIVIR